MSGFSSTVATSTWVGNVVGTKSLRGITINKKAAATLRHDVWRTIMQKANKLYPPAKGWTAPPAEMIDAAGIQIPNVAGQTPDAAVSAMQAAGLYGQISVKQVASGQAVGTVASTKPAIGQVVSSGTTVVIYISKGGQSVVPDVTGKSVADATAVLLAAGFSAVTAPQPSQTQFYQKSATVPKGYVVGTNPPAGSSAAGAGALLLIISLGP
jgi:hypothetical protein